jgi:hypothetical protein
MNLEPNRIYALPDGRELIARIGILGGYTLHDMRHGVAAAPVYLVATSGELLSWDRRTSWRQSDLKDTGRAESPVMERLVLI